MHSTGGRQLPVDTTPGGRVIPFQKCLIRIAPLPPLRLDQAGGCSAEFLILYRPPADDAFAKRIPNSRDFAPGFGRDEAVSPRKSGGYTMAQNLLISGTQGVYCAATEGRWRCTRAHVCGLFRSGFYAQATANLVKMIEA